MAKQPTFDDSMRMIILHGKESFLLSRYTSNLLEILTASFGDTDTVTFDGATTPPSTVLDELRTYDLLMRHKLVIVDNADLLVASKEGSKLSPRKILEGYADHPVDHATLLLRATSWRPGKLDKAVNACGLVYKLQPLGEADTLRWCVGRSNKQHKCQLNQRAAGLLVSRIGLSLTKLDNELSKLAAKVLPLTVIEYEDVAELVGLSREEQAWEIQTTILSGNIKSSLTKLSELVRVSKQPYELLMWSVVDLTRRLTAASDMLDSGASRTDIRKSLKLFGDGGERVLSIAKNHQTKQLATLFTDAVAIDARTRSGTLTSQHGLEMLTVQVCKTIS